MSLTSHELARIGVKKIFHEFTSCLESRNQTFLASGGRNESNSHVLQESSKRKCFHQLHVHQSRK